MFLVIVGAILGISFGIFLARADNWAISLREQYAGPSILFGIIGVAIALVAEFGVSFLAPGSCVNPDTTSIVRLASAPGQTFFIGSRYIDQDLTYFYFVKEPDGALVEHSVRAGLGKIYEKSDANPSVTTYSVETNYPWRLLVLFPSSQICSVDFQVPPGTVQSSYQVG